METFLIVQRGDEIGRRIDLNADQVTIGRGSDNDVILNDPMVSRYHAVLKHQQDRYTVTDLGSSNPVVINDQGLEPGVARQLSHRDVILIGRNVFSFQQRSGAANAGQTSAPIGRPATAQATVAAPMPVTSPPMDHDTNPVPKAAPTADADRTVFSPPPSAVGTSATPAEDNDKTMIGDKAESMAPPPPHFAPPPPPSAVRFDDDDSPTNVGIAGPHGDRVVGTPPSEEEGDLPTQIIPRR